MPSVFMDVPIELFRILWTFQFLNSWNPLQAWPSPPRKGKNIGRNVHFCA